MARRPAYDESPSPAPAPFGVPRDGEPCELQDLVDTLFAGGAEYATRSDLVLLAEIRDLGDEIMEIVELMPPGSFTRTQLADQMNSIVTAHGWAMRYGTVE